MAIIISTKARATAQDPNPKQHYFSFPDDTLMDLATQAIYKHLGVHRQYEFCEEREVPKGVELNMMPQPAPAGAIYEKALEEALRERDDADDFIDALLDEVLGTERAEWSSAYGRAEALEEVRERITALHKPAVDRARDQFQAATAQAAESVPAREHDLQDVRCECCGYMTYHREHMGCIRAARAPAESVLEDDDIDAVALARYKVVPAHESMFHRFAVVAGDGKQQLYLGREVECENMARKFAGAFLDGAFYQANITPSTQAAREAERASEKAVSPPEDTATHQTSLSETAWREANIPKASNWPRVTDVSREPNFSRALTVYFERTPTDDELRAFHDYLRSAPGTWVLAQTKAEAAAEPDGINLFYAGEFDNEDKEAAHERRYAATCLARNSWRNGWAVGYGSQVDGLCSRCRGCTAWALVNR